MPTPRIKRALAVFKKIRYLLRDDFGEAIAAGSVDDTRAQPGPGLRDVAVDGNSKMSIGAGVLNFATGGVGTGDPALWYAAENRIVGKTMVSKVTPGVNPARCGVGWDANQTGAITYGLNFATTSIFSLEGGSLALAAYSIGSNYYIADVLRATGHFLFIKGGAFDNWTLLYPANAGTTTPLYPAIGSTLGTAAVFTADNIRVPQQRIYITPLASDAFTRADGALGNTGGGGSEEGGGDGLAWTVQKGTGAISSNVATFSALGDGLGIATVNAGAADVMVEVVATRSSDNAGVVLRWTDASNYIHASHNGTNLQVVEVVAGTPNTLINTAATYNASARLIISLRGIFLRAYYNNALVGTQQTTAVTSGNNHGLYTTHTGATFNNFVVWRKGTSGEYDSNFDRFF